jgi:hypothetical protein
LKKLLFASSCIIALSIMACTKGNEEKSQSIDPPKAKFRNIDKSKRPFHGDMTTNTSAVPDSPVLKSLKNNHLEVSPTRTIGEAFDTYKYAIKKEWREASPIGGPYYIDYICWFDISPVSPVALREGVVKRGLEIKFVVHEDGETYIAMASRVDIKSDGMLYTTPLDPPEIKKKVTAIYENREITF